MSNPIGPISAPADIRSIVSPLDKSSSVNGGDSFKNVMADAIQNLQAQGQASQNSTQQFLSGENEEVHKVALDTQKTELSFELFLQVRNKVVQAYQEVMRMQM